MLFMSFVVAVPVSHLRSSPKKGNKLLWQVCDCDCPSKEGLVCNKLIADIMVGFAGVLYVLSVGEFHLQR